MSLKQYYIKYPLSMSNEELRELLVKLNTPKYVIEFRGDIEEPVIEEVTREEFNKLIN